MVDECTHREGNNRHRTLDIWRHLWAINRGRSIKCIEIVGYCFRVGSGFRGNNCGMSGSFNFISGNDLPCTYTSWIPWAMDCDMYIAQSTVFVGVWRQCHPCQRWLLSEWVVPGDTAISTWYIWPVSRTKTSGPTPGDVFPRSWFSHPSGDLVFYSKSGECFTFWNLRTIFLKFIQRCNNIVKIVRQ